MLGAGLLGMVSARFFSCTALHLSQASQLPQKGSSSHVSRAPQDLWEPGLPAMASARSFSCTALHLSQASQLPQKGSSSHVSRAPQDLWEPGLPAMASARSFSWTALLASQASQLLQKASSPPRFASTARPVGAGLARDGISAVIQLHRVAFIAGKPAPTESEFTPTFREHRKTCGSRACPRWHQRGHSVAPRCFYRRQASSHRKGVHPTFREHRKTCGSRACPRWHQRGHSVAPRCLHRRQASSHHCLCSASAPVVPHQTLYRRHSRVAFHLRIMFDLMTEAVQ